MDFALALVPRPSPTLVVRARGTRELAIVRGATVGPVAPVAEAAAPVVVIEHVSADPYAPVLDVAPLAVASVRIGRALRAYAEPAAAGTLLAVV